MDLSRDVPAGSNGNKGVDSLPFSNSIIYTFPISRNRLNADSDQTGHVFHGKSTMMPRETAPDTGSGGSLTSNGNKGVHFRAILHHYIYTLFFSQIFYNADSGFSSSFSGVFDGAIYIKGARMAVPVPPDAPMEVKGSPFHPFLILLYISYPTGKQILK
jgi:hypothetical protein